ncbi:hypothetical protein O6072_06345 [Mycolicibacterium neoaurum]|uniref:hypothetical protein n=1 Tax=Mycolicibacterium neoaurum TaxID=1795 RepID=UPI00248BBD8A|nr:hypothetical protein [Mycolicibacterium neoaurum]WBP95799.1 hypothetical protein O7W24_06350 [Mycolicibacterium neoaurum]WBS09483.1 hypothetical protein O6072_06345 [Mycolicibacterium neoaurum]
MSSDAPHAAKRRNPTIVVALAALNFVLLLFPPLTWYLGQNGIWFFLITGVFGVVSLLIMYRADSSVGED